ncbi:MAG TPA: polysaccharide deacetylase family protein [Geomonas sp.]|nr:polysaccharide deacetylase family protein [Geomonas sp.]
MTNLTGKFLGTARKLVCTPVNRLLNGIDPPVLVLLYHRVTTLSVDPEMLAVSPENFRAQLRLIKERFPLVRFEEDWDKAARPAICITFDDGYADNALEALPILEELGVPATFFVSTGTVDTRQQFWWDELQQILLEPRELPASFTLPGGGARSWPATGKAEREELYRFLVPLLTGAETGRRKEIMAELRSWAACPGEADDRHRALTLDELRRLSASPWVTIGAHTVSHSQLSSLSTSAQREEIRESKRQLESWLGKEITVFSYPYGKRSQYTSKSAELCREAGFTKTAANFPGQAHRWSDPQQIPRMLVRNWPADEFARRLKGFWTR